MGFSLQENDYHDALLKSVEVDYRAGTVVLQLDAYDENRAAGRRGVKFEFRKVRSFNAISNFEDISRSSSFGNVNYIRLSDEQRTYIYLSNGVLEIRSDSVEVVPAVV